MNLQRLLYPDIVLPPVVLGVTAGVKKVHDPTGLADGLMWGVFITLVCAFVAWAWISALWGKNPPEGS